MVGRHRQLRGLRGFLRLRLGGRGPPAHEHGYESALHEWEDDHDRPLLARPVPDEVRSLIRETEQSVSALLDERPLAGVEALRSLATWAAAIVDRLATSLGATAPGTITTGPGRQPPGRSPRPVGALRRHRHWSASPTFGLEPLTRRAR